MTRTALLIGSDYGNLRGVGNDLKAMAAALVDRGFTPRVCPPAEATRARILDEYEKLIAGAGPDDAFVVYFTGHGGFAEPGKPGGDGPEELQYIVPKDYDDSTAEDFRGIAAAELSTLQARLTAITPNVTVILDCCHSGLMSRDGALTLRAVGPAPYAWVRAHLDRLQGLRTDLVPAEGNTKAVRVVACAPEQRAYEYPGLTGEWTGILTESLTGALAEAGSEPVTWAALIDRVRHRVVGLGYGQRPEVEGPADRLLFDTEEADLLHSLPIAPLELPGRVRLDAAPFLRVQAGDEFMVMPPGRSRAGAAERIGDLTIDGVSAMSAYGTVTFAAGWSAVPLGARAFRTTVTAPQIAVKVPAGDPRTGDVLAALRIAGLARPAEPGEDFSAEVRIDAAGRLELRDRTGPLHPPYEPDEEGLANLARAVRIHAQATQLRCLVGDPTYPMDARVEIEWGLVVAGRPQPLVTGRRKLAPGDRIYVTVRNQDTFPVYVSMLDIGLSGRIALLWKGTPSGRLLPPGRSLTLGANEITQELTGVGLSWPPGLTAECARTESILVILTSDRQSLSALELPEIVQTRSRGDRGPASRLQSMIDQLATGGSREVEPDTSSGVRYDIHAIDFDMVPGPSVPGVPQVQAK